jgi:hypothetical protein
MRSRVLLPERGASRSSNESAMIPRTFPLRLAAVAAVLAVAACGSPTGVSRADRAALARAKAQWAAHGVSSYTIVEVPHCFCGGLRQIRSTVVNGTATERVYVDDGSPVPPMFFMEIATVDAMFAELEQAIRDDAAALDATYDTRGIPVAASIDYSANTADEEFGWEVVSFTPTP